MYKTLLSAVIWVFVACNLSKQVGSSNQKGLADETTANLEQKQSEGIDFFAKGRSEASWTLEVDFDKAIRFKSLDGTNVVASSTKPVESPKEKLTTISTSTSLGEMKIEILQQECADELTGEKFNKKVTVFLNGKTYSGCGSFLHDKNILGKWTLQNWNGQQLTASDFAKGLPLLQFDHSANKLTGHDGCNQLFAEMELRGNLILIKAIGSTKMACPNTKPDIPLTAKLSNQVVSYYFKDGMLHLYLPDDSVAVFSKS